MVVSTSRDTRRRLDTPGGLLLRRRAMAYPPAPAGGADAGTTAAGVDLLESDLVERGWLLDSALRDALLRLDTTELVSFGATLLADCDALLGADRPHVPLFRDFPASTPVDTLAFYVDRVLAAWLQAPDQPCVLCGTDGSVAPVNPCAHLVCGSCFDGADFSACPICHRHVDVDDPFLRASQERPARDASAAPQRLRVLHLGADLRADCRAELSALLSRTAALPPADVDDLAALLDLEPRDDLGWLPATVPGRETKARLLAWLLTDPVSPAALGRASALLDTATDVLRLLAVQSGGDASLIDRPRLAPVPRPLRRVLLGFLDRIGTAQAVEDMRRHRRAWIAVGERLHPGEHAARYPAAALAFAALRGTDLAAHPDGANLAAYGAGAPGVRIQDDRVRVRSWGADVEFALAARNVRGAVRQLSARPGELLRRLDHLLRLAGPADGDLVLAALADAAARVSPQVLLSVLGHIRTRAVPRRHRVFFPAGRSAVAHVAADEFEPLRHGVAGRVVDVLRAEALRRAAALPRVGLAVLDAGVDGLVAPFAERTAARTLLTLARGSVLPVPDGRYLRLFCHWTESTGGPCVDLDLSVALYDGSWQHTGTCDYTSLQVRGAVHSGDRTDAPPPLGASEFVDLDIDALRAAGARYAVVAILSYNNVPFVDMAEAFAGVMLRAASPQTGEVFDAGGVEQRFDLTGPGKLTMPFVVDLEARTMRWLDVTGRVTGTSHAVHRHYELLALLANAVTESIAAGARVSLGELGRWHAAARADEVLVRDGDSIVLYRRRDEEPTLAFADRLADPAAGDSTIGPDAAATAGLQVLIRGDLPAAEGADVYALYPAGLNASAVRLLAAADLAAALVPRRP